jgi:hypothetical protein
MRVAILFDVVALLLRGLLFLEDRLFLGGLTVVDLAVHLFRRRLEALRMRPVFRRRLPFACQDDPFPDDHLDQGVRAAGGAQTADVADLHTKPDILAEDVCNDRLVLHAGMQHAENVINRAALRLGGGGQGEQQGQQRDDNKEALHGFLLRFPR